MSHSVSLEGARKQLINQLVYFDEEKTNFLDEYYPEQNVKRNMVQAMLTTYTAAVRTILENFDHEILNSRVLIGSKLSIRYLEDHATESFTIVFPHLTDPDQNKISFLSPLGYQLLLSQTREVCKLELPSGEDMVEVTDIKFVNCGEY